MNDASTHHEVVAPHAPGRSAAGGGPDTVGGGRHPPRRIGGRVGGRAGIAGQSLDTMRAA